MGYCTAYGFSIRGEANKVAAFEKDLKKEAGADFDLQELVDTGGCYCKGYTFEDTITKVAAKHPDVLVILTGDGEDSMDNWEQRWRGTETETHRATIPPFTNPNLVIE